MEAIQMEDGSAVINLDRCIGCGLCVPTCDVKAIRLQAKEPKDRQEPPARLSDTYTRIAQERMKPAKSG